MKFLELQKEPKKDTVLINFLNLKKELQICKELYLALKQFYYQVTNLPDEDLLFAYMIEREKMIVEIKPNKEVFLIQIYYQNENLKIQSFINEIIFIKKLFE